MTRIIAVSDTHTERDLPKELVEAVKGYDIIVHAGDFVTSEIYDQFDSLGRLEAVFGNSDSPRLKSTLPERLTLEVDGVKVGVVHMPSHSFDLTGAGMMAREMEVDVLIFGHLHRPIIDQGKKLLLCPGSPVLPRMSAPSVAEVIIEGCSVKGRIVPLGAPKCDYLKYAESLAGT
jgi:hypothetical protein